jgi:sRNA-binding carbon storage regulator CsrA
MSGFYRPFMKKSSLGGGLVLQRSPGEMIWIANGEIKLQVVEIVGQRVRIAIKCNKDLLIQRVDKEGAMEYPEKEGSG